MLSGERDVGVFVFADPQDGKYDFPQHPVSLCAASQPEGSAIHKSVRKALSGHVPPGATV